MNKTLLDTDIYSEILRAVNPTVIGHAQTPAPRLSPRTSQLATLTPEVIGDRAFGVTR